MEHVKDPAAIARGKAGAFTNKLLAIERRIVDLTSEAGWSPVQLGQLYEVLYSNAHFIATQDRSVERGVGMCVYVPPCGDYTRTHPFDCKTCWNLRRSPLR